MAIQQTAQIYDISTMSRGERLENTTSRGEQRHDADFQADRVSPTLSYPQRIAAMLAHAPRPPKLRRAVEKIAVPLSDETKAMLISVHTLNTTLGSLGR